MNCSLHLVEKNANQLEVSEPSALRPRGRLSRLKLQTDPVNNGKRPYCLFAVTTAIVERQDIMPNRVVNGLKCQIYKEPQISEN